MGDPVAAAHEIRPAYEALKAISEKSHFSTMAQALAMILYTQGDYAEAERVVHECREAARPNDVYSQIMWRSILAKLLARKEAFNEANQLANEALRFAADSDFYIGHADALTDLAEVLELQGDPAAAAAALREAISLYELKGNVLATERAKAQLGPAVETVLVPLERGRDCDRTSHLPRVKGEVVAQPEARLGLRDIWATTRRSHSAERMVELLGAMAVRSGHNSLSGTLARLLRGS